MEAPQILEMDTRFLGQGESEEWANMMILKLIGETEVLQVLEGDSQDT